MKFISLFSGIGGFDLGLERAGLKCVAQVEIDKNCLKVLEKHWPNVKRFNDVKECGKENLPATDLLSGGFPCQDLSVAGGRAGLAGERSGLWFEFARIIDELEPGWVIIENVPGLLSINKGKDFAIIIRWLAERGYGVAWRILDAQYFGVAQRRRRVFIVGHFGDGSASQILFESEGMSRDTPPRREKGKVSATLFASGTGTSRPAGTASEIDFLIPEIALPLANSRTINHYDVSQQTYIARDLQQITSRANRSQPQNKYSPTLNQAGQMMVAYNWQSGGDVRHSFGLPNLQTNQVPAVGVRRLTPTECERLMGFPDGFTDSQADSVRYRQLGNAVCVPVAEWIGKRLV